MSSQTTKAGSYQREGSLTHSVISSGDTSKYTTIAQNEFGENSGNFNMVVLNLVIKDVFTNHCTLTSKAPTVEI